MSQDQTNLSAAEIKSRLERELFYTNLNNDLLRSRLKRRGSFIPGGGGSGNSPTAFGDIYNKSSWSDLSDFTNNTTTVNVISNQLQFSGGAGTQAQHIEYNYASLLENFTITALVQFGTRSATSYGMGLALRSIGFGFSYSISTQITNHTADPGHMYIGAGNSLDPNTVPGSANVVSGISFGATDVMEIILQRAYNVFTLKFRNVTTSSSQVTLTYSYPLGPATGNIMPNSFRYGIYNYGGTWTLNSLRINSTVNKFNDYCLIGDSKTTGYSATAEANVFGSIFRSTYPNTHRMAGAGCVTADILACINEIKALAPKKAIICGLGRNDISLAVPSGTWQSNYSSIVSQLTSSGILVRHVLPFVESTGLGSQSTLQTWINSTYSSGVIISNTMTTGQVSSDNVHPNDSGHATIANDILTSGKI